MKKLLLYCLLSFPLITGAQNLFPEFETSTLTSLTPAVNTWGVNGTDVISIVDDGVNTSNKFVQMLTASTQKDIRIQYPFKGGVTYRLSAQVKVSVATTINTFFNARTVSFNGTVQALFVPGSSANTIANLDPLNPVAMQVIGAQLSTEYKEVYGSILSPTDQPLYLRFNRNNGSTSPATYFYDNIQLKVLDCANESIELTPTGTSVVSIYANDINNGAAINVGTNANVSAVTFYEADGVTNADAKFTLNADGTITSVAGVADTDYKIKYTLTSTADADGSGTNDTDSITQTFKVVTTLGVNQLEKSTFSFYPNPTNNVINISSEQDIKTISLFNLLGQEVVSRSINAKQYTLNVENLSKGTYLMKVVSENTAEFQKVVIQ
ncbi:MAG: T9SS type A sorting domain-containing protein [Bacteroidia bacterium]|jgi:hypothetical protein|nr:T9SS type A sorting domain-containing protein [Bacteroidia bacterium]